MTEGAKQHGYAPINGLQMYYEIHGTGEPLLLLHGGFYPIEFWGPLLPALAEHHQVIAPELQGHGRTADIDRPFSYEQFADDAAALLAHLGIARADVLGYSMGAGAGLQLAMRHPEQVRRLVLLSPHYRADGYYPESMAAIATITPELFAGGPVEAIYQRVAPRPDALETLIEKMKALEGGDYAWPEEAIAAIPAPALLIIADSDGVRPEHAIDLFRLFGGGVPGDLAGLPPSQLAIVPGKTHVSLLYEGTDVLTAMIEGFLAAPAPAGA